MATTFFLAAVKDEQQHPWLASLASRDPTLNDANIVDDAIHHMVICSAYYYLALL